MIYINIIQLEKDHSMIETRRFKNVVIAIVKLAAILSKHIWTYFIGL